MENLCILNSDMNLNIDMNIKPLIVYDIVWRYVFLKNILERSISIQTNKCQMSKRVSVVLKCETRKAAI